MFPKFRSALSAVFAATLLVLAVPLLAQDAPKTEPAEAEDEPTLGGSAFVVTDIAVDVSAKSAEAARLGGFLEASRRAWPQLWARMTGTPVGSAPKLPDSAIEGMVSGVEVQRERFSSTRYIATLGVVFDRNRAGARLPASARILQSSPLLLLPLLVDGGVTTIYEGKSPWQQAWARFGTDSTPIDYIRASGNTADGVLLTSWQARRDNRALWRSILARYAAENLLIAEAHLKRSYPGGPIEGTFLARYGPDQEVLARFRLKAGAAGELDTMLDTAVRRLDAAYATALQTGKLRADPALTLELAPIDAASPIIDPAEFGIGSQGTVVNVVTPDAATWNAIEAAIRGAPGVDGMTLLSLAIGGTSKLRILHTSDYNMLRFALDQRGLRLEPGEAGLRVRPRVEGEAPLTPPVTAPPAAGEESAAPQEPLPADVDESGE